MRIRPARFVLFAHPDLLSLLQANLILLGWVGLCGVGLGWIGLWCSGVGCAVFDWTFRHQCKDFCWRHELLTSALLHVYAQIWLD